VKTIHLNSITDLSRAAEEILIYSTGKRIFCFYGEMGAGKTTLIKEICKQLGVNDEGSSPTFSIVNEYKISATGNKPVKCYHFDLYRLKSESEFFDIGYEDYIFSGNYCFTTIDICTVEVKRFIHMNINTFLIGFLHLISTISGHAEN
jgi:tRNA threonylcarbamoyladenosine biosynthesis protein TsaE